MTCVQQQRAGSHYPTKSAANSLTQEEDMISVNTNNSVSSTSLKLNTAISTTEFLLNLPLEGSENVNGASNRDDCDDSCASSFSSLGGGFMIGFGDDDYDSRRGRMSCSDKLRLCMKSKTKQNNGKDMQFSFNSLKSFQSQLELDASTHKKPNFRRTQSEDVALHSSHRALLSLLHDGDHLHESDHMNIISSKSSTINFPLRRSLGNGLCFDTTSQKSLCSKDRLKHSLSNTISNSANDDMGNSSRHSSNNIPNAPAFRKANSTGTATARHRRSSFNSNFQLSLGLQSHSAHALRPSFAATPQPLYCPRKARRRRARNCMMIDANGELRSTNHSRSAPSPRRSISPVPPPEGADDASSVARCFIKPTKCRDEVDSAQKVLLSSLIKPRRRNSDPNLCLKQAMDASDSDMSTSMDRSSRRRRHRSARKTVSADTAVTTFSASARAAPERRGVKASKSLNVCTNVLRSMAAFDPNDSLNLSLSCINSAVPTRPARATPERRGVKASKSLNANSLRRMTEPNDSLNLSLSCINSMVPTPPARAAPERRGVKASKSLNANALRPMTLHKVPTHSARKHSLSPVRTATRNATIPMRVSRAERLGINQQNEPERRTRAPSPKTPQRCNSRLAQLAALSKAAATPNTSSGPACDRQGTEHSLRSFKETNRNIRKSSGITTSSNDILVMALSRGGMTRGGKAAGGSSMKGSRSQATMSQSSGSTLASTSKNAEWSTTNKKEKKEKKNKKKAKSVNPFHALVNMTSGTPPVMTSRPTTKLQKPGLATTRQDPANSLTNFKERSRQGRRSSINNDQVMMPGITRALKVGDGGTSNSKNAEWSNSQQQQNKTDAKGSTDNAKPFQSIVVDTHLARPPTPPPSPPAPKPTRKPKPTKVISLDEMMDDNSSCSRISKNNRRRSNESEHNSRKSMDDSISSRRSINSNRRRSNESERKQSKRRPLVERGKSKSGSSIRESNGNNIEPQAGRDLSPMGGSSKGKKMTRTSSNLALSSMSSSDNGAAHFVTGSRIRRFSIIS